MKFTTCFGFFAMLSKVDLDPSARGVSLPWFSLWTQIFLGTSFGLENRSPTFTAIFQLVKSTFFRDARLAKEGGVRGGGACRLP